VPQNSIATIPFFWIIELTEMKKKRP